MPPKSKSLDIQAVMNEVLATRPTVVVVGSEPPAKATGVLAGWKGAERAYSIDELMQ